MDDMDRVQECCEQYLDDALAAHYRRTTIPPPNPLLNKEGERKQSERGEVCEDCGEPIPEARRKAMPGCRRCIDCQTLHENWRAL